VKSAWYNAAKENYVVDTRRTRAGYSDRADCGREDSLRRSSDEQNMSGSA
jgi:hypothetical protein